MNIYYFLIRKHEKTAVLETWTKSEDIFITKEKDAKILKWTTTVSNSCYGTILVPEEQEDSTIQRLLTAVLNVENLLTANAPEV